MLKELLESIAPTIHIDDVDTYALVTAEIYALTHTSTRNRQPNMDILTSMADELGILSAELGICHQEVFFHYHQLKSAYEYYFGTIIARELFPLVIRHIHPEFAQ